MIILAMSLFEAIGLSGLSLRINSLGCPECRVGFRNELKKYLLMKTDALCTDCRRRAETNPLRVFDCKVEKCRDMVTGAPSILESLCGSCEEHFASLQGYLNGSHIFFSLDPRLVRGLDYYNRTTFEIQTDRLGAQNAVAGGGRYDGLIRLLGGPDHPAMGFAVGVERVVALLEENDPQEVGRPDIFVAALGETAQKACFRWTVELRKAGLRAEMDYGSTGLKSQMKKADRLGVHKVLMVGEDELSKRKGTLRDMKTKVQEEVDLENIVESLKEVLMRDHT
jgi:histidyl-tRNA synthetase